MEIQKNDGYQDDRLLKESGVEARLAELIMPTLTSLGFRLVRVQLSQLNGQTLQIMAERPDGTMQVADCEKLSKALSPLLDLESPISGRYNLEISSPGMDRPLVRKSDFEQWQGALAKLETNELINDRKRFKGFIGAVTEDGFTLKLDQLAYDNLEELPIKFNQLLSARLVLTDELIKAALKADKLKSEEISEESEEE